MTSQVHYDVISRFTDHDFLLAFNTCDIVIANRFEVKSVFRFLRNGGPWFRPLGGVSWARWRHQSIVPPRFHIGTLLTLFVYLLPFESYTSFSLSDGFGWDFPFGGVFPYFRPQNVIRQWRGFLCLMRIANTRILSYHSSRYVFSVRRYKGKRLSWKSLFPP
jgi:hypothetical protein